MPNPSRPLSVKELAAELGRSPGYVWAMRRRGLSLRATFADAVEWLKAHADFRVRDAWGGGVKVCEGS